jgi:hypothetical protein
MSMRVTLTKEDIAELRGDVPIRCDFCKQLRSFNSLEPEEAGAWVCHHCMRRWLAQDVGRIKLLLAHLYTDLEAAKWWFSPQSYLADRTPHELLLSDQSGPLMARLQQFADGSHA